MDNPQHYQPLSHALHPPQNPQQLAYVTPGMYTNKPSSTHREEEEEEEEDGDDEGMVEEQLSRHEPDGGSSPSSPQAKPTGTTAAPAQQTHQRQDDQASQEPDRKRRPGRPRGSKNRKPRVGQATTKQEGGAAFYHTAAGVTPPQHPDVNAHNQQYYEFQWRVLNLCAEFYGAAEELIKGTPPLVIAQCYQMGPGNKVDPIIMLSEAKRICDTLLANPSQLISSPPPPIYSIAPTLYQAPQPIASTSSVPISTRATSMAASTSKPSAAVTTAAAAAPVISNPQSFVVSLGPHQPAYSHSQYSMYPPPAGYPTNPYYQYPAYSGAAYYSPQPQPPPPAPVQSQPVQAQAVTQEQTGTGNQGAWADEETERLKKLAEDSRVMGGSGDIEWDWVVHQWGAGRTRHQILIKATALGLKESSSRGVKRRRETETGESAPPTPATATHPTATASSAPISTSATAKAIPAPSASPSHASGSTSTPNASPAMQHTQRPPPAQSSSTTSSSASNKPVSSSATSTLPWPMPTVAVNTPSPVIAVSTTQQQQQEPQRTSYYRARPSTGDSATSGGTGGKAHHPYMYQPNGSAGGQGQGRLAGSKENGK
ncbi:hypothetical protein Hypma_006422 [Hypsizygus marmoreus]|uniref:Uncharacterized protein n=1 Tax=Hypsizygus marmoreus TaxID=39966 RepID=A0A369JY23_HYPMA|nr:hypothetical protein Hypma_006422 [Hypsizygus marmoreus]